MQDDIRPGDAASAGRKPKIIEPLNPEATSNEPVIESFVDEPAEEATETPTSEAAAEPHEETVEEARVEVEEAYKSSTDDEPEALNTEGNSADKPKRKFQIGWPPTKKDWMIIGVASVLLVATGGAIYSLANRDVTPVASTKVKKTVKPPPPPITSKLTGRVVAEASVNERPVTGVMIENSAEARPQSGLDDAGIVFEAIAEGGITRFVALYQDTAPDYIGPVRSARPYYVQWCMSFDCSYAHVGGSPDGLALIKSAGTKDLDQYSNAGAYHRISSRDAPHNVYTSMADLNQLEASKGYGPSSYNGFARKADKPYKAPNPAATGKAAKDQETRTPATAIDFTMSGPYFDVHFDYDAASNSYKRSQAGEPHMAVHKDGSQVQLAPKVVIGLIVPMSAGGLTSQGGAYSNYQTSGTGKALIYQDGTVSTVNWNRGDARSDLTFTDDAGKPFALDAGQTWITALVDVTRASHK